MTTRPASTAEYAVFCREGEHTPKPSWGCHSGDGWRFAGITTYDTVEQAMRHADWSAGARIEEMRGWAETERREGGGNMAQLALECAERTEYRVVTRWVTDWQTLEEGTPCIGIAHGYGCWHIPKHPVPAPVEYFPEVDR